MIDRSSNECTSFYESCPLKREQATRDQLDERGSNRIHATRDQLEEGASNKGKLTRDQFGERASDNKQATRDQLEERASNNKQVGVEHDHAVGQHIRDVGTLEGVGVALQVALGKLLHQAVDLLGFPWQPVMWNGRSQMLKRQPQVRNGRPRMEGMLKVIKVWS
eukprot:1157780-Pelagomonas_calceolata.AAC.5